MATHQIMVDEYVCPRCFYQLHSCICEHRPRELIHVDIHIQECVRLLNRKGYITQYSCSSHLEEYQRCGFSEIYLVFPDWIDFKDKIPQGFTKDKGKNIFRYRYAKKLTEAEFIKVQTEQLQILLNWCKRLPECTHDKYGRQRAIPLA